MIPAIKEIFKARLARLVFTTFLSAVVDMFPQKLIKFRISLYFLDGNGKRGGFLFYGKPFLRNILYYLSRSWRARRILKGRRFAKVRKH